MDHEHTRVCGTSMRSRLDDPALAWNDALTETSARRDLSLSAHALVLLVASTRADGARSLRGHVAFARAAAPVALVIGAHGACDVAAVHGACLRHVVVYTDPIARPGWVHAIDLNTPNGLVVDGEPGIRRVDARHCVRIGAGSADLLALSLMPGENVDVASLRELARSTRSVARRPVLVNELVGKGPARAPTQESLAGYSERLRSREVTAVVEPCEAGGLVLSPRGDELERGIVIGRYDRCNSRLSDELVSRVHALLLAHGEDVVVIDAASTNGTEVVAGARVTALGVVARSVVVKRRGGFLLRVGKSVVDFR